MCIRDRGKTYLEEAAQLLPGQPEALHSLKELHAAKGEWEKVAVSYTHLRAHETVLDLVCRLLLEKKNTNTLHTSRLEPIIQQQ